MEVAPVEAAARPAPALANAAIPHFRQVNGKLLTGGQPGPEAWSQLAAQGVSRVINLRPKAEMDGRDEAGEVAAAGMAYEEIPVAGAAGITEASARELWLQLDRSPGPVLVHCASGNRVGALLALGAARYGDLTPEQALEFGKSAGLTSAEARVRELLDLPPAAVATE